MSSVVLKAVNKWRRIYQLKRHGKHAALQLRQTAQQQRPYNDRPLVTAVVQLFNKRENIDAIVTALIASLIEEIIVIDDGSSDGALEILPSLLTGKNHFIIRSNDLFEVRTYSRALDFARGEFVALLQDDDLLPNDGLWIEKSIELFNRHPRLSILGGRDGLELSLKNDASTIPSLAYTAVDLRQAELPFTFVDVVNRAPMVLRRDAIVRLGGIDNAFAPALCDDVDLCLRAWKAGQQVGVYTTGFVRDVGVGGMRLFNADMLPEQGKRNWRIIYDRYAGDIASGRIGDLVSEARKSENLKPVLC